MALKKEFSKRDVQRMRNLIQGKHGDATISSVGYRKKEEVHEEGDVWEEDGRQWTIKNGIKQNISKIGDLKESVVTPYFCPSCNKIMNKRNDKVFYKSHRMCFNCVVEFEHKLRKEGKWDEYQKKIKNEEIDNMIKDFKTFIEEKRYEKSDGYVTQDGDLDRWVGKIDQERVDKYLKEGVEYLENLKQ
jgi:hypothetical protein